VGELEDGFVGGIAGKGFTQERDIVAEVAQASSSDRRERRGPARTSLRRLRHLPRDKQVDLPSMVFIAGKALVNLRSGKLREALCPQRLKSFTILEQANDVVDGNPGSGSRRGEKTG
jgi:hypothetical protein